MAIGIASTSLASPIVASPEHYTTRITGIAADFEIIGKSFYLDVKVTSKVAKLSRTVIFHGGVVESFLSKDVNYLITDEKRTDNGSKNQEAKKRMQPPVTSRAQTMLQKSVSSETSILTSSGVLQVATNLGIPVIRYDDFFKLLSRRTSSTSHGHLNPENGARPLKPSFIKFDDMTSNFRPYLKEFTSFPRIKFSHSLSNNILCPFFENIVRDDDVRTKPPQITPVPVSQITHVPVSRSTLKPLTDVTNVPSPLVHKSKQKGQEKQRGYCECCDAFYTSSLDEHLEGQKHQNFANDVSNYSCVDNLLNSLPSVDEWISTKQDNASLTSREIIGKIALIADSKRVNGKNETLRKVGSNIQCTSSPEHRQSVQIASLMGHIGERPVGPLQIVGSSTREGQLDSKSTILLASAVCGKNERLNDGNMDQFRLNDGNMDHYFIDGEKVAVSNNELKSVIDIVRRDESDRKIDVKTSSKTSGDVLEPGTPVSDSSPPSKTSFSALSITAGYITDALAIVDYDPDATNLSGRDHHDRFADNENQHMSDRVYGDIPLMDVCPQTTYLNSMLYKSVILPHTDGNCDNIIPHCDIGSETNQTISDYGLLAEKFHFVRSGTENDCHTPRTTSWVFTNQYRPNSTFYYENTVSSTATATATATAVNNEKAKMLVTEIVNDLRPCHARERKSFARTSAASKKCASVTNKKTSDCIYVQSEATAIIAGDQNGSYKGKKRSRPQYANQEMKNESSATTRRTERVSGKRRHETPHNTKQKKTTVSDNRFQELSNSTVTETHILNANCAQTSTKPNSPSSPSSDSTIITSEQNAGHNSRLLCGDSDLDDSSDTIITSSDWQVKMTTGLKIRIVRRTPIVKNLNESSDFHDVKPLSKSKTGQKRKQTVLNTSTSISDMKCKRRKLQF